MDNHQLTHHRFRNILFLFPLSNMFLKLHGASGRFTFDEICSCIQKSLRRNDTELALDMAYEFQGRYVNALKSRLMQNCTEDCPDIDLIAAIHAADKDMSELIPFVPVISNHLKSRDGIYGLRIVCDMEWSFDVPTVAMINGVPTMLVRGKTPDLISLLRIAWTHICDHREKEFIAYFQPMFPKYKLSSMYTAMNKHITFLSMLCMNVCMPVIRQKFKVDKTVYDKHYAFHDRVLPKYVYDKHVGSSPASQKTYKFFIENCVISPRLDESEIETTAKRLYITTNRGVGDSIRPVVRCKVIDPSTLTLIQTQLITSKYKPQVFYASMNGKTFDHILKGPYRTSSEIELLILSDRIKNELLSSKLKEYQSEIVSINQQLFYCGRNFIAINPSARTKASSKLETDVVIYSGNKFVLENDQLESLSLKAQRELISILAFRKVIGTNDTCNRNIIYLPVRESMYTIDDPALFKETPKMFKTKVAKDYVSIYDDMIDNHFDWILDLMSSWYAAIVKMNDIDESQRTFMMNMCVQLSDPENWVFD